MLKLEQPPDPVARFPRFTPATPLHLRRGVTASLPVGHGHGYPTLDGNAGGHHQPAPHMHSRVEHKPALSAMGIPPMSLMSASHPLHSPSEDNLLRRKTPNGTVIGAYQSSLGHSYTPRQCFPSTPTAQHSPLSPFNYDLGSLPQQRYPSQYVNPLAQGPSTVVQLPNQPYGPTASGLENTGLYGPYWHDGTYVPYRPNATRDPRYYSPMPQSYQQVPGFVLSTPYSQPSREPVSRRPPMPAKHSLSHLSCSDAVQSQPQGVPNLYQAPLSAQPAASLPFHEGHDFDSRDRDRVFNLALHTYRELLSFLETVKKHNTQAQHGYSNSRPGIYPKPPSPAIVISGEYFQVHRGEKDQLRSSTSSDPPRQSSYQHHHGIHAFSEFPHFHGLGSRSDPYRSRLPSRVDITQNLAIHSVSLHPPSGPDPPSGQNIKRFRSNSDVFPTNIRYASHGTVLVRSQNALTSLSEFCLLSNYQWIDGINLCGCLAYGLGDYNHALELYNRVLQLDPRHVEASSNLAATLLALDRKSEAEQHWIKVVKQAPSYFEAVEHLVGLLCANGRGKDAVMVIEHVERSLAIVPKDGRSIEQSSDASSLASHSTCVSDGSDTFLLDYDADHPVSRRDSGIVEPGFGSSGYSIPGCDNGRMLALVHAKGNMMYSQGDNTGAAKAFEDVVLIATARKHKSIKAVVQHVLEVITATQSSEAKLEPFPGSPATDPVLLHPEQAAHVAKLCFPQHGELPGLMWLQREPNTYARKGAILTTSNSLLSLAKIYQDGMSNSSRTSPVSLLVSGVREILALYYLSLSLQPSPSTANNVGILLAGVQKSAPLTPLFRKPSLVEAKIPGVVPGSGVALALAYYNYGLVLDARHAHLYTNLGSLLKDIGQLDAAIDMYKRAVNCDGKFDIALANLANAVKDKGRISEAIDFYHRAVEVNPDFAEAVCGLTNALNSVCRWRSRGGIGGGQVDRWHVDDRGMLLDSGDAGMQSSGWMKRVVDIVDKQLRDGEDWGMGVLTPSSIEQLVDQILRLEHAHRTRPDLGHSAREMLKRWAGRKYEGARLVRLVERLVRRITWRWYRDRCVNQQEQPLSAYNRPRLPTALTVPPAPTVLPFHTFTTPMSAKQVRLISQRNGHRISASTLKMPWLPSTVFPPPLRPSPVLKVGYLSSDFNNHPLAHLMQSVFGLHDRARVECYCYATTASDNSIHRQQIESEAPHFYDGSTWSTERIVKQIVADGIHILVNLNGYTRGARNEVFAARPAPIHMSFMGFAGTLGAEWSDYILADETALPPSTLRPWRRNVDIADQFVDNNCDPAPSSCGTPPPLTDPESSNDWVYGENIVYSRSTFFCCDHRQSAPDSKSVPRLTWEEEQTLRWRMRAELFPNLAPNTVILANFNQLYKIEPTTFRTWLRILSSVPNAVLWLLRFPDLGEANLKRTAQLWAGHEVAGRVIFTDVAPKNQHIARAKVVDLFLDTPECNAHTTAADVLWSGTPLLTYPRYEHKMCSRMAASILKGALPREPREERLRAEGELIASSDDDYETKAIKLARDLVYPTPGPKTTTTTTTTINVNDAATKQRPFTPGRGVGRLAELRRMLTEARWTSDLFDTKRWVSDLEDAYEEAWRKWVAGEGGDIWLDKIPRGRTRELP